MIEFLKKYWFFILLIGVLSGMVISGGGDINDLEEEAAKKELKIKDLKELVKKQEVQLIELAEKDTVYIDSIIYLKETIYEDVISVDTMSISELQDYFTGRYPE